MKLSKFVAETLREIELGITEARATSDESWIAPGYVGETEVWAPEKITFEIAITTNVDGEGGIRVFNFGELKGGASKEMVNKIAFNVPVFFNSIPRKDR
ncbi:hypothetical protein ACMA5I_09075 [Paracoccaceae bacterium GXU_MW_L88]